MKLLVETKIRNSMDCWHMLPSSLVDKNMINSLNSVTCFVDNHGAAPIELGAIAQGKQVRLNVHCSLLTKL